MEMEEEQNSPGGEKHRQANEAINRGQEYQKRAAEFRARGQKDLAVKGLGQAIAEYTQAIRVDPKHSTAYVLRARAYEEIGEEGKAEADLAKARGLNPDQG